VGKWLRLAGGSALLFSVASGAHANIIFEATPAGTGNNVVFNQQPANQSGNTVRGNINDANNTLVQFSSTQVLLTPAQGQSRIESRLIPLTQVLLYVVGASIALLRGLSRLMMSQ
jgi:hypothetical protein